MKLLKSKKLFAYFDIKKNLQFFSFLLKEYKAWCTLHNKIFPSMKELKLFKYKIISLYYQINIQDLLPLGFKISEKKEKFTMLRRVKRRNDKLLTYSVKNSKDTKYLPKISVIVPVYNSQLKFLQEAIDSVLNQTYLHWELCISDDSSTKKEVVDYLKQLKKQNPKIKVLFRKTNGDISKATNDAVNISSGNFLLFLDHDDKLAKDALAQVALYVSQHPRTDVLYSDQDKIDIYGNHYTPRFKPDWSPELLLSSMYISHLVVIRRSLFIRLKGLRVGFEGSQDYDLLLRATEKARHIGHIPSILYHWRFLPNSSSYSRKNAQRCSATSIKALQETFTRRNIKTKVYQSQWAKDAGFGIYSRTFLFDTYPSVTIIILARDNLKTFESCITSILDKTTYPNYEILVVGDNNTEKKLSQYILGITMQYKQVNYIEISNKKDIFNQAYSHNQAAKHSQSDYLLFLNDNLEVLKKDWLNDLVGHAQIKGIGAVGAKLLCSNQKVWHAGILQGFYEGLPCTASESYPFYDLGLPYAKVIRNYNAISTSCLLTPRKLFLRLSGFGDKHHGIDYCYRLISKNFRCVYVPDAELKHNQTCSKDLHLLFH